MSTDYSSFKNFKNSGILPAIVGYYVKREGLKKVRNRIIRDYPTPQDLRDKLQEVHDETNKYLLPFRRITLRSYIKKLDNMPYSEYSAFVTRMTSMKLLSFLWPWIFLWCYPLVVMIKNSGIDGKTGKQLINEYVHFSTNKK